MSTYQYQSPFRPPQVGSSAKEPPFRSGGSSGAFWLVGGSARTQLTELLDRLEKVAQMAPTKAQIEQVSNEFVGWYKTEYAKQKRREFPAAGEDSILKGLLLLWATPNGQVSYYRSTQFLLYQRQADGSLIELTADYDTLSLSADAQFVAYNQLEDLSGNLQTKIRKQLQAINRPFNEPSDDSFGQWVALVEARVVPAEDVPEPEAAMPTPAPIAGNVPVSADLQPSKPPFQWKPYAIAASVGVLLGLGYAFRDNLGGLFQSPPSKTTTVQPTVPNPTDYTSTTPTANHTGEMAAETAAIRNVSSPDTNRNQPANAARPQPAPVSLVATAVKKGQSQAHLQEAQKALAMAEGFRRAGKSGSATEHYQKALRYYQQTCQAEPTLCPELKATIATIELNLILLTEKSEF